MTATTTNFSGLLYYNPVTKGFNPVVSATLLLRNTGPINEGDQIDFEIVTWNIPDGTTLYWRLANLANINSGRFIDVNDSVVINNHRGYFSTAVNADVTVATGTQTFDVVIDKTPGGGIPSGQLAFLTGIEVVDSSVPIPDTLIMNLDGTNPGGLGVTGGSNGTGQDGNGYYILLNRNYTPYLAILDSDGVGWTVSGGENNLVNTPVTLVVASNAQNISVLGAVYVAVNPGNNSVPFTFSPPVQTWNDQTTHGNNGTLVNGPTYNASFGGYFAFDGSNDYISLPSNFIDWVNTPLTISTWYRTSSSGIMFGQTDSATPGAGSGWCPAIWIDTSNNTTASTFYHNTTSIGGIAALADGNWHNITVTYSGGTQKIYVDGVLRLLSPDLPQTSYASTYYYYLGTGKNAGWPSAGAQYFTGDIASFKVWTDEKNAGEVTAEFNDTKGRFLP